jgi:transposase
VSTGQYQGRSGTPCNGEKIEQIEPDWFGKLSGFTLHFDALALAMDQQMTFAAVARLVNESWHRGHAICSRYVDRAVAEADLSAVSAVAIDETSCRRGYDYLTIAADAEERKVVFVTTGREAKTIARFAVPSCSSSPASSFFVDDLKRRED